MDTNSLQDENISRALSGLQIVQTSNEAFDEKSNEEISDISCVEPLEPCCIEPLESCSVEPLESFNIDDMASNGFESDRTSSDVMVVRKEEIPEQMQMIVDNGYCKPGKLSAITVGFKVEESL